MANVNSAATTNGNKKEPEAPAAMPQGMGGMGGMM